MISQYNLFFINYQTSLTIPPHLSLKNKTNTNECSNRNKVFTKNKWTVSLNNNCFEEKILKKHKTKSHIFTKCSQFRKFLQCCSTKKLVKALWISYYAKSKSPLFLPPLCPLTSYCPWIQSPAFYSENLISLLFIVINRDKGR